MARNSKRQRTRRNPTMITHFLCNTATSRRTRTPRAQNQNRTEELAERAAFLKEVAIAQELGLVDANFAQQIAKPPSKQDSYPKPPIGSYGYTEHLELDEETEALPCAAHAAYHCARRYAEDRERLSQKWALLEEPATACYLLCQKLTKNWTFHPEGYDLLLDHACTCDTTLIYYRNMDLMDVLGK
ncbi:hypothetical protein PCASD_22338 [Puccinia coronata f. sp. avenae]|uniref:CxC1-like cysteine cluster associated with KDZ transposases domain-containing protein n=1 Tax=Puccinia coronata f. sp. avenae TaxID=200324 RepID=A0A2N5U8F1_9BASI|nr:hypothetical protein PCASD_22338 [Puccinia coronata f. sp. avenae]